MSTSHCIIGICQHRLTVFKTLHGRRSFLNSSPLCKDMHYARIYTLCTSTQKTKRNVPPNNLNNILRLKINILLLHLCTWECQTYSVPFPLLKRKHGASTISQRVNRGLALQVLRNVPHCANMETIIETYWNSETKLIFFFFFMTQFLLPVKYKNNSSSHRMETIMLLWPKDTLRSSLSQWIKNI